MGTWGISLGRWFGVDVRLHGISLLLLTAMIAGAAALGASPSRALALWLLLLGAVVLREIARVLAGLALNLQLTSVVLTPVGGLFTFAGGRLLSTSAERVLAITGVLSSLLAGGSLFALCLSLSPGIDLLHQPWISSAYLVRSLVWSNLLLGALHLLPAVPLDAGRLFRSEVAAARSPEVASNAANGLGRLVSFALLLGGLALGSTVVSLTGLFVFLAGTLDRYTTLAGSSALEGVRMRDVMLEDFYTLSSADTLEEALHRALHAAQDVFPVVRSGSLVGAISRRRILDAIESTGNGYVQGIMTRDLITAAPDDRLLPALEQFSGHRGAHLVPVVDGDRVIGIVTPQNLSNSGRLLARKRRLERSGNRSA